MVQMQREIDILRATEDSFRKKVLELELDNDDLERTERYTHSYKLLCRIYANLFKKSCNIFVNRSRDEVE